MDAVESTIITLVQWLRLAVETTGALVIAVGAIMAIYGFGRARCATVRKLRRGPAHAGALSGTRDRV